MERFDKLQRERDTAASAVAAPEPAPTTNGAAHAAKTASDVKQTIEVVEKDGNVPTSNKRKSEEHDDADEDDLSDVVDSPPAKKKVKKAPKPSVGESDEQMAKRLQAEFSAAAGSRSTRGGSGSAKKSQTGSKKEKTKANSVGKTKKRKSAAKVRSDDDSEVESTSSPKPEKEKKGGFHKPLNLSEPLQALLGEPQLSRPETVKRIWAYVKARDLQDPSDKRQIRCDEAMRAVFKSDKVHMFTMNKILATQLYPVED